MKISEETLKELRQLIPELGKTKNCHINVQLNLTYYEHSNSYIESVELWTAEGETLANFSDSQTLISYIKAEITSYKGSELDA